MRQVFGTGRIGRDETAGTGAGNTHPGLSPYPTPRKGAVAHMMPRPSHLAQPPAVVPTVGTGLPHIKLPWTRQRHDLRQTGIIYYLERTDGLVKIGTTQNYPQRRQALVHRHGSLKLIAWEIGSDHVERERHQQFAHLRVDPVAEWFRVEPDLLDHILSLLAVL